MGQSSIDNAKSMVEQAKRNLEIEKNNRATAKANGSYKNATKNCSFDGKVGNVYDYRIYVAQRELAQRKEELAKAKANAKKK